MEVGGSWFIKLLIICKYLWIICEIWFGNQIRVVMNWELMGSRWISWVEIEMILRILMVGAMRRELRLCDEPMKLWSVLLCSYDVFIIVNWPKSNWTHCLVESLLLLASGSWLLCFHFEDKWEDKSHLNDSITQFSNETGAWIVPWPSPILFNSS